MAKLTFKPKQVSKKLLFVLPDRAQDIITKRYGLGDDPKKMTLESIGTEYKITRERVRQIENFALNSIKRSDVFEKEADAFNSLRDTMYELGGVIAEDDFLDFISSDKSTQNHAYLFLVVGDQFNREKETPEFKHRWSVDAELSKKVHEALEKLHQSIGDNELIEETKLIERFSLHLKDINDEHRNEDVLKRWLAISKAIGVNPLNEWGKAMSPNVSARGMRDYAFLVLRHHGSPMHFTEVADEIANLFGRKTHVATCHNELIKDSRFVLVGRGLYALTEWGYSSGIVRDVIQEVIRKHGPLTKDDIIDKVFKERYVKENTIIVNLQNGKFFKKGVDGRYALS